MYSLPTEITETGETVPHRGWIFYDRDCRSCSELATRLSSTFATRGFEFAPLQERWVQDRLGMSATEAVAEMRVLMRTAEKLSGADAMIFLAEHVWWVSPLAWFAALPGARALLRRLYAHVAANRHCAISTQPTLLKGRTRWLPLIVLPLLALATKPILPAWGFMWAMAFAIFAGCKWLTLSLARMQMPDAPPLRATAYLFAWPGMDAARFLSWTQAPLLGTRAALAQAVAAIARVSVGAVFLCGVARHAPNELLTGWLGMIGMILLLHFGVFDLVSLAWRKLRVDAPPLMKAPLRSRSVDEFWGRRWNAAFNQLATRFVFRPVARRCGPALATVAAFGASGFVHELVISLPAGAGYGLPTAYFLLQGAALLVERRFGSSRLFTIIVVAAPAFWLFHPAFVRRVILPFMQAIGAL